MHRIIAGVPLLLLTALAPLCGTTHAASGEENGYVGSKVCGQCHEKEYGRFTKHSSKARSWRSISVMRPKLTPEELEKCYACHTTGYGRKSGFTSFEKTPHLADVGCETCHGPGRIHASTGEPDDIVPKPNVEDCSSCHDASRIKAFDFKPLTANGAH